MRIVTPIESSIMTQERVKPSKLLDILFLIQCEGLNPSKVIFALMLDNLPYRRLNINTLEDFKFSFVNKVDDTIIAHCNEVIIFLKNIEYAILMQFVSFQDAECFGVNRHNISIAITNKNTILTGMKRGKICTF